uniref:Uncharacterized protein n=1 Tax=Helianthus annuus TaxID=4232 RepID=A0A251TAG8_HELAN
MMAAVRVPVLPFSGHGLKNRTLIDLVLFSWRFDLLKDQDHDQLRPWYNDEEDEDDVDGELCIRDSEQALTLDFNNVTQARWTQRLFQHDNKKL